MSTYTNYVPMRIPRLVSLFLAWAFSIIGGSVGLNALIKSNQEQSRLRKLLPAGTTLTVDVDDIFHSGVVVTTVCALIAVLTTIYLLMLLVTPRLSNRFLPFQSISLAFCALWLFATQIAVTHFFATRSAQVHAFLGNTEVPASLVQVIENQLGATTVYKHIDYLRLVAILPWFAFLFTAIAAGVELVACRRRIYASPEKP